MDTDLFACPAHVALALLLYHLDQQGNAYQVGQAPPRADMEATSDLMHLYLYWQAAVCPHTRRTTAADPQVIAGLFNACPQVFRAELRCVLTRRTPPVACMGCRRALRTLEATRAPKAASHHR